MKIINENQPLLLELASLLNANACIDKEQIRQLLCTCFPHLAVQATENSSSGFSYRHLLLRKCAAASTQNPSCSLNQMPALVMNMEKTEKEMQAE